MSGTPGLYFERRTLFMKARSSRRFFHAYCILPHCFSLLARGVLPCDTSAMSSRKIIAILLVILIGVATYSFVSSKHSAVLPSSTQGDKPSPTPEPLTGTFVDQLRGRFIYYANHAFYEVTLPSRVSSRLAGVGSQVVTTFPEVRPAWSSDGKYFAFVVDHSSITVSEYTTGKLVSRIPLDPPVDISKKIDISFSPDSHYLLLKQQDGDQSHIRFFDTKTGKLITEQASCLSQGAWLSRIAAYTTSCLREGKSTIVLIFPSNTSAPIISVGTPDTYAFLNIFDSSSLLVTKKDVPGKLTLLGKFSPLDPKQFKTVGDVHALADLNRALADKIEIEKKTEKIDDLTVASSSTYALFHTQKGLWIIALPLSSDPYFLFEGSLPSIQPL